ncbi:hypothetical protein LINPERHAP1_LOCUS7049 [Linum perenne]
MAADPKQGAIVTKGHDEAMKISVSLLRDFELPEGLLPLEDVVETGYVKETGYFWIVQNKAITHEFKVIGKQVSYDLEINGFIEKNKVKNLKGVQAKELIFWPPVSEITVDDPPTGKIHFKSIGGIIKTFPIEAFAAGQ